MLLMMLMMIVLVMIDDVCGDDDYDCLMAIMIM